MVTSASELVAATLAPLALERAIAFALPHLQEIEYKLQLNV